MHRTLLALVLVGGGGKESAPAPKTPDPAPAATVTEPAAPAPEAKKEPEGPPLVIEKLAVAFKGKSLDLNWDVSRKADVPTGTILFVQTVCKVGYNTKTEDETVSGVDVIPSATPRSFKLPAFQSVGLPFEPTWCTVNFSYGAKGSPNPTKLSSFCWKKGAVSEGACS
jgi:hypothetical protein